MDTRFLLQRAAFGGRLAVTTSGAAIGLVVTLVGIGADPTVQIDGKVEDVCGGGPCYADGWTGLK